MVRRNRDENQLLGRIAQAFAGKRGRGDRALRLGIGDDAALYVPRSGYESVLTCDWFLEGTHFLRKQHPADAIGWKCLARAVSDVAAMGGIPRCFLLSLALPPSHTGKWLGQFLGGLRRASRRFRCVLAGGDTTRQEKILINADLYSPPEPGAPPAAPTLAMRTLYQNIRKLKLEVAQHVPIHGRAGTNDEFVKIVNSVP